jgi:hypothetical protein
MKTKRIAIAGSCLAVLFAGCTNGNGNGSSGAGGASILDPTGTYGGMTYPQLATAWTTWLVEMPGPTFPVDDTTGASCTEDQGPGTSAAASGVFFLADAYGPAPATGLTVTRSCTVPAGQMLFFPMTQWIADNGGMPAGGTPATDAQLQGDCTSLANAVTGLTLEIDGKSFGSTVSDFSAYLVNPVQFSYTMPTSPTNFYATMEGIPSWSGAVADSWIGGYWILLAPLASGSHTIHFTEQSASNVASGASTMDVTYDLTVE